jgi:hypothetical protein
MYLIIIIGIFTMLFLPDNPVMSQNRIAIFNGKDLSGWRIYNGTKMPEAWKVKDYNLYIAGRDDRNGKKGGSIIYGARKFKNFELTLEWKIRENGNSGIFYMIQELPGKTILASALEYQLLDAFGEKTKDRDLMYQSGSLYDLIPPIVENSKPTGKWNKTKIIVKNGHITHWLNGKKLLETELWIEPWRETVLKSKFKDYPDVVNPVKDGGYIGLQDHGSEVYFRKISVREL